MRSDLSTSELQHKLIYSMIVAGKSATFTDAVMRRLVPDHPRHLFSYLHDAVRMGWLDDLLRTARTGNYTKLAKGICELLRADIDLAECTPDQLEQIHGIGMKTSRFFILWTRPGEQYAALDVHILRWLRAKGYPAPEATPSSRQKYLELEQVFLREAKASGKTARELDFEIWGKGSGYTGDVQSL